MRVSEVGGPNIHDIIFQNAAKNKKKKKRLKNKFKDLENDLNNYNKLQEYNHTKSELEEIYMKNL